MPSNSLKMQSSAEMLWYAGMCGGWLHYLDMIQDAQTAGNWQEWHWPVRDSRGHMYVFWLDQHYLVPDLYILNCTPPSMAEFSRAYTLWRELLRRCLVCVAGAARLWRRVARAARPYRRDTMAMGQ